MFTKKILKTLILCSLIFSPLLYAYGTLNGKIVDDQGAVIAIDGVNWSGFQDNGFVDELYGNIPFYSLTKTNTNFAIIDMLTHPWDNPGTGVDRAHSVAFKTIRLPIQPNNLRDTAANSHFNLYLTDPNKPLEGNGVFCQTWGGDQCSAGLSVSESLYKIIGEFKKNNIRVLVDFHQTPVGRNGNVVEPNYSLAQYSADVTELAAQIKARGLTNVIGIDVFNEPHNLLWFQPSGTQPAWTTVIQTAAQAIYRTNPDLLVLVEGPSIDQRSDLVVCLPNNVIPPIPPRPDPSKPDPYQTTFPSGNCPANGGTQMMEVRFSSNWGENFKDLLKTDDAKLGINTFDEQRFRTAVCGGDEAFCTWLLGDGKTVPGHLVFSPHVYGESVAQWQTTPTVSPFRFNWNWGFLIKAGIPVVVGESGYLPDKTNDVAFFQQSLAPYLKANGMNHNLFYWTWNTNSGDTGGVRMDANTIQLVPLKESDLAGLYNVD